jgi:hypothetical protein
VSEKKSGGSVGIVLLALFLAVVIVFLGLGPMRQEFSDAGARLQKKSIEFARDHKSWVAWVPRRPSLSPETKSFTLGESQSPAVQKKGKDLDKLSKKDKEQLDSLINKLNN